MAIETMLKIMEAITLKKYKRIFFLYAFRYLSKPIYFFIQK